MINDVEDMYRYILANNGHMYYFYREGGRIYYDLFSDPITVSSRRRRFIGGDLALFAIVKYFSKFGENPYYSVNPRSHLSSKIRQMETRFASRKGENHASHQC